MYSGSPGPFAQVTCTNLACLSCSFLSSIFWSLLTSSRLLRLLNTVVPKLVIENLYNLGSSSWKERNLYSNAILRPVSEGWGRVIFSVCVSVHTRGGGGVPTFQPIGGGVGVTTFPSSRQGEGGNYLPADGERGTYPEQVPLPIQGRYPLAMVGTPGQGWYPPSKVGTPLP